MLDGQELSRVIKDGRFVGGVFAMPGERAHGACWAAVRFEDLLRWGLSWRAAGRLGRDLFVARVAGLGKTFYHEDAEDFRLRPAFDPKGPAEQVATADPGACNPGLGCALQVSLRDVEIVRVPKQPGKPSCPMSFDQIERYAQGKLRPVMLRQLGGPGTSWGGSIEGHRVYVRQEQDGLWQVQLADEDERLVVARQPSRAAAITKAQRLLGGSARDHGSTE